MKKAYPKDPRAVGRQTQQLFYFATFIKDGDIILASDGKKTLGIGRIIGPYHYVDDSNASHRRPVEWLSFDEWELPTSEGLRTTVHQLQKNYENLISIERLLHQVSLKPPIRSLHPTRPLGIPGRIHDILERKGQVILYGPPGTGKTYWAEKTAHELATLFNYSKTETKPLEEQTSEITGKNEKSGYVRICCFHPAYGYEDFIEGYRPKEVDGQLHFELNDGIFKKLCKDATEDPTNRYYLIIDEINRGDIPRIFGELLTIMEKSKRGKSLSLPISGDEFAVPPNVYIIGTMNTADRSIALLDTALRRRFGFIELMPDTEILQGSVIEGIPLALWLKTLNQRICEYVGHDARNLQIGHSYLMDLDKPISRLDQFVRVVREDIIPLLEEYCYEDYGMLERILGNSLVDRDNLSIRSEIFERGKEEDIIAALLAPNPDISASFQAVDAEPDVVEEDESDDDENEDKK
jgi:5-methylcytosine-specific restriction protein B